MNDNWGGGFSGRPNGRRDKGALLRTFFWHLERLTHELGVGRLAMGLMLISVASGCGLQSKRPALPAKAPKPQPPLVKQPLVRSAADLIALAERQWLGDQKGQATETLAQLFTIAPDHLEGRVIEALVHGRAGDPKASAAAWVRVERIIVIKGKLAPFLSQHALLGAGEHYLKVGQRRRGLMFLEELWRRHSSSEAAARAQFMVAKLAFDAGEWRRVGAACSRLRRVLPRHALNRRCVALTAAARRLRRVGILPKGEPPRWKWEAPLPQGNDLYDVWVSPQGEAVMVGDAGTVVERDRRGRHRVIDPLTRWPIYAVYGRGKQLVAVGGGGGVLAREGRTWRVMRKPSPRLADLFGVWIADGGEIVAVGDDGVALHFSGSRWSTHSPTDVALYGVWGSAKDNIFAVGDEGALVHFDGTRWRARKSDAFERLRGIWGANANHVLMAGARRTIVYFNGKKAEESVQGLSDFNAIWGKGPRSAWAVGRSGAIIRSGLRPLTDWKAERSGTGCALNGVWGGGGKVLAVGDGGTLLERRGGRWRLSAGGMKQRLVAVHVGSVLGKGIALGDRGRLMIRNKGRWRAANLPVNGRFFGGWGDGRHLVAVGARGLLVAGSEGSFRRIVAPTPYDLLAAGGCSGHVSLVGERGVIVRLEGDKVALERPPSGHSLRAVAGCRMRWAVGDRGTILRRQAGRWVAEQSGTLSNFSGLWVAADGATAVAVGDGGLVMRREAGRWRTLKPPVAQDFVAVWGRSTKDIYIISSIGQVLSFDGERWRVHASPAACLLAIHGSADETVAVGCSGSVISLRRPAPAK